MVRFLFVAPVDDASGLERGDSRAATSIDVVEVMVMGVGGLRFGEARTMSESACDDG